MKVKSESEVTESCPTLSDPMDCSPPGSSIHGVFQARVLEWGAIAISGLQDEAHLKIKMTLTQGRERVCGLGLMHTQPTYIVCVMTLLKTLNLLW